LKDFVDIEAIKAFVGMKVLVFGLGILGGGVAAANWLIRHGARVTVTDLKTEADLAVSLDQLDHPVTLKLGGHNEKDIRNCDLVLFNPDIPVSSRYVRLAKKLNKCVENEATLFYRLCRLPIVAVTGTRGKTTTCAWIEHFLKHRFAAVPAGNSPDNPFMHTLQKLEDRAAEVASNREGKAGVVVNELPSYHLEYFQGVSRGPEIALVTNIYRDHLNRHTSMEEYVDTKANVFRRQKASQLLILNYGNVWTEYLRQKADSQNVLFFSALRLPGDVAGLYHDNDWARFRGQGEIRAETVLETRGFAGEHGRHNIENLLASALVAHQAGVPWPEIQAGVGTLPEIAFRQEIIFRNDRLMVVNDNAATSPDGCAAAVRRFGNENCILITGGTDRELTYEAWAVTVRKRIATDNLIFLEGSATDKMLHELSGYIRSPDIKKSLDACFSVALQRAGDFKDATIVFSPGAKSFEKFDNEFERGRAFNTIVDRVLKPVSSKGG